MASAGDQQGQATVELVALLPLVALIAALAWQAVIAGQAWWLAGSAAHAAARARALGDDPSAAVRRVLPGALEPGARVRTVGDGVELRLVVPAVVPGAHLGTLRVRSRLEPQA